MDEQHMRLVDIINDLYAALKSGKAREKQAQILDRLIDYTKEHFAQEEALMRVNRYAGLAEQEKLHRAFEAEIAGYQQKMESGKSLGVETMNFLKKWLVNHIQVIDKQYGTAISDGRPARPAVQQPAAQDYQWGQ
jgi:hemerythrin-like metal-binding protein